MVLEYKLIGINRMSNNIQKLADKNKIIQTHKCFGNQMNQNIINALINLFDTKSDKRIIDYINVERASRDLNTTNYSADSILYGENSKNPTLMIIIKKNNIDFIHLTIHLCIKGLNPKGSGIIHFFKNIYNTDKSNKSINRSKYYSIISVNSPDNKPNSLIFSINDVDSTIPSHATRDNINQINKELDVIITVLNRLFDEADPKYYIGKYNNDKTYIQTLYPIHNKTNTVLKSINSFTKYSTRKNKGSFINPVESSEPFTFNSIAKLHRKKSFRAKRDGRRRGRLTRKSTKVNKTPLVFNNSNMLLPNIPSNINF